MGKVFIGVLVVAVVVGGYLYTQRSGSDMSTTKSETTGSTAKTMTPASGEVKEFTTTAYYDDKGVWYSLKEMRVKQGDKVRIKATNTKGMHDLVIDELGVKQELPLNQEVVIEFTADKKGEFVFYCSKPNHRAKGQWGTLYVE